MSGRRSHTRFSVNPSVEGMVRVLRDVTIQQSTDGELTVISREPGVLAERMALEISGPPHPVMLRVEVADSRPLVMDGAVRHRLRLRVLETPGDAWRTTPRNMNATPTRRPADAAPTRKRE